MNNYSVTFYEYGEILVEARNEQSARNKAMKRAKQMFIPEIHEELEIAAIELDTCDKSTFSGRL